MFFGGRHNESSGQRSSHLLIKQLCTGVMGDVGGRAALDDLRGQGQSSSTERLNWTPGNLGMNS